MSTVFADSKCELGGYTWDLRYTASALRALQMTLGSLEQLAARLMAESMGAGMSPETQALLVWAGQKAAEPRIKLGWVKRYLHNVDPQIRSVLISWAAADFCTAVLAMAESRMAATEPSVSDEDDDDLSILGHQPTSEPLSVIFAGSTWPLLFDMRAIRKLGEQYAPEDTSLHWLKELMVRVASGDVHAMCGCLWAGLLRDNPGMSLEETLVLLDEASPDDLAALPEQLLTALQESFGRADSDHGDQSTPWDWETALAFWFEKGRSEEEFWRTTFRTFTSISNGLAKLYRTSKSQSKPDTQEGWTLDELLTMGRRR